MAVRRPILRYHGGKWRLAPWIISHFPPHRVYVEPFGGAASVLLRKPRSYAEVYNDLDGEIVSLFRVMRDRGDELRRLLELTPFSRGDYLEAWNLHRDPLEQARRTIIRAFMGFGSSAVTKARSAARAGQPSTGFRANSNRSGTTPARDWRNYPSGLPELIDRLRGVCVENRDALEIMSQHDGEQTLHYCDPPYAAESRDSGSDYRHEMSDANHVELAEFLRGIQGKVVVSGYACPLYARLYGDWRLVTCAAHADGARDRTECLWMNYEAQDKGLFDQ